MPPVPSRRPLHPRPRVALLTLAATLAAAGSSPSLAAHEPQGQDVAERLKRLSLEELMTIEVSSVSKKPEQRLEAPAAIAVITADDIRRAGVTSLADALRLAPGVHVAQIDSNKWAVGIRGFASRFSRSVLVLIDGRSVYTPLFAGTYWEVQDTLLEDIDRIEVIRGPGGTLWGANAFSGVINIITKSARDTHGSLLTLGLGTEEKAFVGFRHGGETDGEMNWRVYAKGFERDAGFRDDGIEYDDWAMGQTGFRLDWDAGEEDGFTLQGDAYAGYTGQRFDVVSFAPPFLSVADEDAELGGANVLGRWTRSLPGGGELALQAYYDWTYRHEPVFREERGTMDFDFQHRLGRRGRHEVIWGGGYRLTVDDVSSQVFLGVEPNHRAVNLLSALVQDEMRFAEGRLRLTFGSKFEKNDFSGFEVQPNVRLLWSPRTPKESVLWAAVSRAVRTPSRVEEDLFLTQPPDPATGVFPRLIGPGNFESEEVLATEIGYRVRPASNLFVDVAAFYNDFDSLLGFEPGMPFLETSPLPPHVVVPLLFENSLVGRSQGFEVAATVDVTDDWRLHAAFSLVDIDLEPVAGSKDATLVLAEGQVPNQQFLLRSHWDVSEYWELDAVFRWGDDLPADGVDSTMTLDLRVAWSPNPDLEVAIIAHDLLSEHHREFAGPAILSTFGGSQVERGIFGKVTWRF